ncbi:rhodanese domain-containing protein CG4456-like isoform X2 [Daktulosphaira vitifoliae]|uniref:rhodanese domain-containing protein CG4456-like isoform X2 n=1 Tax=Daktulosphaira vitifoliae TaxID=58002 RepID=UPI0021AADD0E|nr:rhodanese domain-containing protein CG4456-like isoform X2 [Daktulosphaira vitifoliae]
MIRVITSRFDNYIFSFGSFKFLHCYSTPTNKLKKNYYHLQSARLVFPQAMSSRVMPIMDINYSKLLSLINLKTLIIDVREKEEINSSGTLPNSINIPLKEVDTALSLTDEEFEKQYNVPKPNLIETEIIFSCAAGVRSYKAATIAKGKGFTKHLFYQKE